jgi:hypothetical protein
MPEDLLPQALMRSFESNAPFDEFQNFGIDPEEGSDFEDIDLLDLED